MTTRKATAKNSSRTSRPTGQAENRKPPAVRFFNRDESWLLFNRRVLEEAQDASNPLLERVKFLAITASNLDEFYEIRLAGMLQRLEEGLNDRSNDGKTVAESLETLKGELATFNAAQYRCWNEQLLPALAGNGIHILTWDALSDTQRHFARRYYETEVDPLLTPVTIDPAHPFPRVINKALCIALLLRRKRKGLPGPVLGVVTVPRSLPRTVALPNDGPETHYILLADLIEANTSTLYRGYEVLSSAAFRITRNSNLYMQEEEARSVLESVRAELHNRRKGDAVRLEIDADAHPDIVDQLRSNYDLDEWQVYSSDGPVNLSRLMNLYSQTARPDLKFKSFTGREFRMHRSSADIFEELRRNDVLLHHPYDSYDTVTSFIESASEDDRIVSIKQTLYRTSEDSSMFQDLIEAAPSTEVTVVVELMARFDEASNIRWARALEDAGVQVFHGILGLKTHCKLALMVRRDPDGVTRSYAHLGTGNYNPVTAKFYTDVSLLTSNPAITNAVHWVFNFLTARAERDHYAPLQFAPITMLQDHLALIQREAAHARAGRPARIIAKMNSLNEPTIIEALYEASQAGVHIDLIVRGICTIRPGVRGLSEHIRVRSIVGRFLEHSRIYCFANGGSEEIYCGSADWMPRNLFERCETIFPVLDPDLRARLRDEVLSAYLADTAKARIMCGDGSYSRPPGHHKGFSAQDFLMRLAEGRCSVTDIPADPQRKLEVAAPTVKARRAAHKPVPHKTVPKGPEHPEELPSIVKAERQATSNTLAAAENAKPASHKHPAANIQEPAVLADMTS